MEMMELVNRIETINNDDLVADCIIDALNIDAKNFSFCVNKNRVIITVNEARTELTATEVKKVLTELLIEE